MRFRRKRFEWPRDIVATFQPQRTDDLRPGATEAIGWRGRFSYAWTVTKEDGGPYVGQRVWIAACDSPGYLGWIPDCDLVNVTVVSGVGDDQ